MRRRALLGTAAVGAFGLGGCLGRVNPGSNLGVPANESDCPPTPGDRVVCMPETDPGSAAVTLTADSRSESLPATFEFTLRNGSVRTLSTNHYAWSLWKRVDDEWHHVVPEMAPAPLTPLAPGTSHEWQLTAEHELPGNPGRDYTGWSSAGTVSGLGGGEYAFTTDGWFGERTEGRVGFAVLLDIDAPELTLEPTAQVTDSARDGDTVAVRGEGHGAEERRAEFVLRRVDDIDEGTSSGSRTSSDDADNPRTAIPEQAAHDNRLRNTLSYFEDGIERVRYVEENHGTHPAFGVDDPYTIRYGGELYEVSASELGSE